MNGPEKLAVAAAEVQRYWRDWPQERRDKVRALSSFLADAIEALSVEVEASPRGLCGVCGRLTAITKSGGLRLHNGDISVGGYRQVCEGMGSTPVLTP